MCSGVTKGDPYFHQQQQSQARAFETDLHRKSLVQASRNTSASEVLVLWSTSRCVLITNLFLSCTR